VTERIWGHASGWYLAYQLLGGAVALGIAICDVLSTVMFAISDQMANDDLRLN
jgi:hypothetical protein